MFMGDIMRHVSIHGKHDYAVSGLEDHHLWEYPDRMNIRAIRRSRGLTQIQLSELSYLGQSTVSRAEKGDDGVTLGNFKSIAAATHTPTHRRRPTARRRRGSYAHRWPSDSSTGRRAAKLLFV